MIMIEIALTLQQLNSTSNVKSNYFAFANRFQSASLEVSIVSHHVVFASSIISSLAKTKIVFDSFVIDALTKSFENFKVNAIHFVQLDTLRHLIRQKLIERPYSTTVQETSFVQTSTSTQSQSIQDMRFQCWYPGIGLLGTQIYKARVFQITWVAWNRIWEVDCIWFPRSEFLQIFATHSGRPKVIPNLTFDINRSLVVGLKSWCSSAIVDGRTDFQSPSSFKVRHGRGRKLDRRPTSAHWAFGRASINCMQVMSIRHMTEASSATLSRITASMEETSRKRAGSSDAIMARCDSIPDWIKGAQSNRHSHRHTIDIWWWIVMSSQSHPMSICLSKQEMNDWSLQTKARLGEAEATRQCQ